MLGLSYTSSPEDEEDEDEDEDDDDDDEEAHSYWTSAPQQSWAAASPAASCFSTPPLSGSDNALSFLCGAGLATFLKCC